MSLFGDWLVKRAQNTDVERRHLNKILQEIRTTTDELQEQERRIAQMLGAAFAIATSSGEGDSGGSSPPGATGPAGSNGATGSAGPMGLPIYLLTEGIDGEQGPPGIKGAAGANGSTGAQGPTGQPIWLVAEGVDGDQGPPGINGLNGATGSPGPTGPPIFMVAEALDGEQGIPGVQGIRGIQGIQGPAGPSTNGVAFAFIDIPDQGEQWAPPTNQRPLLYDLTIAISDETTAITTGTAKVTWPVPRAMTIQLVKANLTTASSSGLPTFDVNKNGTSIFSTVITIDVSETTSLTAATPPVLTTFSLAADDVLTFDIDVAGTGAKGAKITILGYAT